MHPFNLTSRFNISGLPRNVHSCCSKIVLYWIEIKLLRSFFLKKHSPVFKYLLTGFGLALATTISARQYKTQQRAIKLNQILEDVKAGLRHEGQVVGAWIEESPHLFSQNKRTFPVYQGGVITEQHSSTQQFHFKVDAKTGVVIEFSQL